MLLNIAGPQSDPLFCICTSILLRVRVFLLVMQHAWYTDTDNRYPNESNTFTSPTLHFRELVQIQCLFSTKMICTNGDSDGRYPPVLCLIVCCIKSVCAELIGLSFNQPDELSKMSLSTVSLNTTIHAVIFYQFVAMVQNHPYH